MARFLMKLTGIQESVDDVPTRTQLTFEPVDVNPYARVSAVTVTSTVNGLADQVRVGQTVELKLQPLDSDGHPYGRLLEDVDA